MASLKDILTSRPENIPIQEYRFYSLLRVVHSLAWVSHFSWLLLFFYLGVWPLGVFNMLSVAIFTLALYLNLKRKYLASIAIGTYEVIAHQILAVAMVGLSCGFQYIILLSSMLPFLLPKGKVAIKGLLLLSNLVGFLLIIFFIGHQPPVYGLHPYMVQGLAYTNIIITFLFLGIFGMYFSKAIEETEEELELEREKSDVLLHNILPHSIVARLKSNPGLIADGFESVSVLFVDIVGFTKLSEKLPPKKLIAQLNELFSEFDLLTEKHGMEKIKTIGDAYMVFGGLPHHSTDHVYKLAQLGLDILQFIDRRNEDAAEKLEVRIGMHTGPAIAGVIGVKKFAYDIWGDTVNTASRMESHGVAGKIQVTQEVKDLLCEKFSFERRIGVSIKGKGVMDTYFLTGRKAVQTNNPLTIRA